MEKKWTHGPWKVVEDRFPSSLEVFSGKTSICECWRRADAQVEMANAHLIAAAPELYEALESLLYGIENSDRIENYRIEVATKALAKALGETGERWSDGR